MDENHDEVEVNPEALSFPELFDVAPMVYRRMTGREILPEEGLDPPRDPMGEAPGIEGAKLAGQGK